MAGLYGKKVLKANPLSAGYNFNSVYRVKKNLTRKFELNELKHELTNFDNPAKII